MTFRSLSLLLFIWPILLAAEHGPDHEQVTLRVIHETLNINGVEEQVFNIVGEKPNGERMWGFHGEQQDGFDVKLYNDSTEETSIHWHGLELPNDQDGVPYVTQLPIAPGEVVDYTFELIQAGTFWMHSHLGVQEKWLLAAPLIITAPDESDSEIGQEVTILFQDYTFAEPQTVLEDIYAAAKQTGDVEAIPMNAFLANRRTLSEPEIIDIVAGQKIRLRLINGAAETNFFIPLENLARSVIEVDGEKINPDTSVNPLQLAIAQRIDVLIDIPESGGVFPILAQAENSVEQTGIVLVTEGPVSPDLSPQADGLAGRFDYMQELNWKALTPLPDKVIDREITYILSKNTDDGAWEMNHQAWPKIEPEEIKPGERVKIILDNQSDVAHPMHLHGHSFQVVRIDDQEIKGAMRDTIHVLPRSKVEIIFDADNSGIWMFHCHKLSHMEVGMQTTIHYEGYPPPDYYLELIGRA
ncbi:MAG: multicopper oxidase family protein [Gammaproteobacteria bacterium]